MVLGDAIVNGIGRLCMLSVAGMVLSGCAMYSVAGEFEDSGQMFFGHAAVSPVDIGMIDVQTADGRLNCSGSTQVTRRGSLMSNVGAQGRATVTCTDGRTFKVDFIQTSESGGHGQGIDDSGRIVKMFFDMSSSTARARLEKGRLDALIR